jgi:peptidoglycan/LPS O-acetylase OafA/YrhL
MTFTHALSRCSDVDLQNRSTPSAPDVVRSSESPRIYGLDILRAFSIFTVIYAHGHQWVAPYVNNTLYALPLCDGVTIFFVLSGFLIGNIIIRMASEGRTSPHDLLNFLRRRWLRTVPNYALVLLTLLLLTLAMGRTVPEGVSRYVFFFQNFASERPAFFPESWSLPVEEWFYLLFPLMLFALLPYMRLSKALMLCLAAFILCPTLLRIYRVEALQPGDIAAWSAHVKMQVVTRLDSIAYGVVVAVLLRRYGHISMPLRKMLFAGGVALFLFDKVQLYAVGNPTYIGHFTLLVETIAAALLIPFLCTIETGKGWAYRLLTCTSKISYSLYLVHLSLVAQFFVPVVSSVFGFGDGLSAGVLRYAVYVVASVGIALALYRYYEKPILRLRDKRWPDSAVARSRVTALQEPAFDLVPGRQSHVS